MDLRLDPGAGRPAGSASRPGLGLLRFDGVQRAAHWANALLFAVLIATALPLYLGSLGGLVGRRHLLAEVHLWAGLVLPLPLVVALLGPWGRRMRRDVRRCNLWTREEMRWIRGAGTSPIDADKFNPGQKLNVAFTGGAVVVMLASGAVMHWFGAVPVSWRTGATFVHDVCAFAVFAVVAVHVVLALTHRDALRSMVTGRISPAWAARHAPAWLRECDEGGPDAEVTIVAVPGPDRITDDAGRPRA
jgi:formate dehydrogenase subunit gamma